MQWWLEMLQLATIHMVRLHFLLQSAKAVQGSHNHEAGTQNVVPYFTDYEHVKCTKDT
jgi:hypothetical protein